MKHISGILFLIIAALPYVSMLWTRPGTHAPETADREVLRILSPHRREVRLEYGRGFADWMRREHARNVTIQWLDAGGTSKMLKDLESRFKESPQAPGVDLMFGGGIAPYYRAIELGWLQAVTLPGGIPAEIPATCAGSPVYDPDGRWFGVALSGFGILYNKVLLERMGLPTPQTWGDLARPEFFSWVGSGDPRSSGSVHMCYEIILQAYGFEEGWSLITRMCGNVRRFGESGGAVPHEVAAGEVAAGMVIDQYAQTVIDNVGADALGLVLPGDATVIGADAIAQITNAPAPELATRFIEYALSEPGQRLLFQPRGRNGQVHPLYRMPVWQRLYEDPDAPKARPYATVSRFLYNEQKGSRRWRLVNDLIGIWMIDSHQDLSAAWQAVIARGSRPEEVARLCAAPVREDELDALETAWDDSRRRLDYMSAWAADARARYRRLIKP